jgi:hypothetical protein
MEWDELIGAFRELGGVAENVRLGRGALGRGIFVCDPAQPVKLHAPENLLFPASDLEIRDGQLVLKSTAKVGERERLFFEAYERHFGWGSGGFDESWNLQKQWSELPAEVVHGLTAMHAIDEPEIRFLPPSVQGSLDRFVHARWFAYGGGMKLAPVVDLLNYSSFTNGFTVADGVGVTGRFPDEVFVRYNLNDAWGHAINYAFASQSAFAYSLSLGAELPDAKKIAVRRDIPEFELRDGVRFPKSSIAGDTIDLPFLMLGNATGSDLPRAVFRILLAGIASQSQADGAFDGVAHFNRMKFLALLRMLRKHEGALVRILEEAAINQLETMSFCIGART